MDTFNEPLTDSATTGLPSPDSAASSKTGPRSGETGYEQTPKEYADRPGEWAGIVAETRRREAKHAAEVRKAIDDAAWCKVSVTQLLNPFYRAPKVLTDPDFPHYLTADLPPSLGKEQCDILAQVLPVAKEEATPAGPGATGIILGKLAIVVLVPDSDDYKLMMATYIEDLQNIPADVLEAACRRWRRTQKFWPTIAELRGVCTEKVKERRQLLRRLYELDSVRRNPAPDWMVTADWHEARRADGRATFLAALDRDGANVRKLSARPASLTDRT